ncbi:MAG: hypothetical protein FWF05_01190 [Oscillospiraceae bacterium]|nr:hypothetical protein [Oscillospiraceae bacterium]
MKRLLALLITATLLLLGLSACFDGSEDNPTTTQEPATTQEPMSAQEPTTTQMATDAPEPTTQVVEAMTDTDFDAQALFKRLEGYWNDEYDPPRGFPHGFTSFIYQDGKPFLHCGAYGGEHSGYAALIGGRESDESIVALYFLYPASDDDMYGPLPERTTELQIDLTGIDNGELRIQHKGIFGTTDWIIYTYDGKTMPNSYAA